MTTMTKQRKCACGGKLVEYAKDVLTCEDCQRNYPIDLKAEKEQRRLARKLRSDDRRGDA